MKTFDMYYTEVKQVLLRFVLPWVLIMLATAMVLYSMQNTAFDGIAFGDIVIVFIAIYFLFALVVIIRYREVPCRIEVDENLITITLLRGSFIYPKQKQTYKGSQIHSITMKKERREVFYYIETDTQTLKVRTQCKWYERSGRDNNFYSSITGFKRRSEAE